jgi:UDP-N-acetylmuramoyl-tripeptide--D-alanyl-D-alanine ligase
MRSWLKPSGLAKLCRGKLVRSGRAARRVATDSRTLQPGDAFVALRGSNFDGHEFLAQVFARGASGVIVDRPIADLAVPDDVFVVRVDDTGNALMQIAAEHRRRHDVKVVGITGSCGKTSTKDMLGRILEAWMPTVWSPASFNNHVGVPLSLLQIKGDTRAAVIEIGTSGPGEVAALSRLARPDIGIVTCVGESHLSGLGSVAGVAREKAGLFEGVAGDGVAILNGDDSSCRAMAEQCAQRTVLVRLNQEADWFATDLRFHGLGTSFRLQGERPVTLPRLGSHNVYNALFAIAAASELGMELDPMLERLCQSAPGGRRLEYKQCGSIRIIDDTYNMNPVSARAALMALAGVCCSGRRVVVFGEMLELGEQSVAMHRQLGEDAAIAGIDLLVTVGPGARPIAEGAIDAGFDQRRVLSATDPTHALEVLQSRLADDDLVLCKASRRIGLDRVVDGLLRQPRVAHAAEGAG